MTPYETMFVRRSVRSYDQSPLDEAVLQQIRVFLSSIKQLEGTNARFELLNASDVEEKKAPHYVLAYCANSAEEQINVGYCLEQLDLYLQAIGLGSLWLGLGKPGEKKADYCIMMALGKTDVPLRSDRAQFDRLDITKVSSENNSVARAAILAPSACNSQPWYMEWQQDRVRIRYEGRGVLKFILKRKMSRIDLGIICAFIQTALEHEGKVCKITPQSSDKDFFADIAF